MFERTYSADANQTDTPLSISSGKTVFYVANYGNDDWSGTLAKPNTDNTDGPFFSLEQARDTIRHIKTIDVSNEYRVIIRGGKYQLTKSFILESQDSGNPDEPIIYQAYANEEVILSGGSNLPSSAFKLTTDKNLLNRLPPQARQNVFQLNLTSQGITDLGILANKFRVKNVPELFFNGQRMTLARWPNNEWATIVKIIKSGSADEGGEFNYKGYIPSRWNAADDIWLHGYWCYDWNEEYIKIKSIDKNRHSILLETASTYPLKQGNPSPRRFYALNIFEELDSPGEYYIDRKTGTVYLWPPTEINSAEIFLSTLNDSILLIQDANNIIFRGLTFENSIGNAININGGENVKIQSSEIRNINLLGIDIFKGKNHQVEACDIHDTGTGGIVLSGGDRKTLTPANHQSINNHIWNFATNKLTYSSAIKLSGVGNRAANNLIHDAPHQAISIDGNDHIIEYNIVHNVVLASDDSSALYTGRNPSFKGNIIQYNFWHHIGSPMGHGSAAIYIDDGQGGVTIFGNIFLSSGQPGKGKFGAVFSHGGHDIFAENNIFIDSKRALGSVPWNDKKWKEKVQGNGGNGWNWQDKFLKQVDITKPPFITRYPELKDLLDPKPNQIRINRAVRNVFVNVDKVSSGNWDVDTGINWSTNEDPGFVDADNGNFQLLPDSKIFTKIPDFKSIPFEKMGLIENSLRPLVKKEDWKYEHLNPIQRAWRYIKKSLYKE